jgi:hypothetical protein
LRCFSLATILRPSHLARKDIARTLVLVREGESMDRSRAHFAINRLAGLLLAVVALITAAGCPAMLATGMYVWEGGNMVPAQCDALKDHRVVVMCRPPSSHEYRHAGASRRLSKRVSEKLVEHVKGVDVVNPREVDNWVDESDWGDYRELAEAVNADLVVHIELDNFELFKGKTLYQGNAQVNVTVYDMRNKGNQVWSRELGEVLYPVNSGIPAQDKPQQQFEREFVEVVADQITRNFYRHDPNDSFAMDAMANR